MISIGFSGTHVDVARLSPPLPSPTASKVRVSAPFCSASDIFTKRIYPFLTIGRLQLLITRQTRLPGGILYTHPMTSPQDISEALSGNAIRRSKPSVLELGQRPTVNKGK